MNENIYEDIAEIVKQRLDDGRHIADCDIRTLVEEVFSLRNQLNDLKKIDEEVEYNRERDLYDAYIDKRMGYS